MNGKEVMELFESLPFGICFYTLDSEEFNRENFQFEMGNEEFLQCIGYERESMRSSCLPLSVQLRIRAAYRRLM